MTPLGQKEGIGSAAQAGVMIEATPPAPFVVFKPEVLLELLVVALAGEVGPETIKWHMRNLLSKLNAANRRHAVDRARLLGILD